MLRPLLLATSLLAASGAALAHGDYGHGRVVTIEPRFSVSFGTAYPESSRVLVERGGTRYWTYKSYHPAHTVVVPRHDWHAHHDWDHDWDDHHDDD